MRGAAKKSDYFIGQRGWLDLLGSIPSLGLLTNAGKFVGLFRLARLSRLARIRACCAVKTKRRWLRISSRTAAGTRPFDHLVDDPGPDCCQRARAPIRKQVAECEYHHGWGRVWYSIVTITTVGYGDFYPVTTAGRITATFIMFMGVGIIGALASILASLLVGSSSPAEEEPPEAAPAATACPLCQRRAQGRQGRAGRHAPDAGKNERRRWCKMKPIRV